MSTQTRLRRGTTTQHQSFTGAEGEVTVDTTKDVVVVHDGSTAGGVPMARQDRPRGWTKQEHFTSSGTWTKSGKTDLKRIRVTIWGGGGAGRNGSNGHGGGGGGQGGYGYIVLEASQLSTNVSVTVAGGGSPNAGSGGTSSFGSYISASGGAGGNGPGGNAWGGMPGRITGAGAVELGGQAGGTALAQTYNNWEAGGCGGGSGGGAGRNSPNNNAIGVCGGGGGGSENNTGGAGAKGSVLIEEIYGDV